MSNVQFQQTINSNQAKQPQVSFGENSALEQIRAQQEKTSTLPTRSIYQYPQMNIYPQSQQPAQASTTISQQGDAVVLNPSEKSAVNVYITNPAGYMGPNYYNGQYTTNTQSERPSAATGLEDNKPKKTKRIVELTDDYIKSLENYLRNQNKDIRMEGLKELVKRFEEDKSRYDDPALNALLNIALQDKSSAVRSLALSLAESGAAKGDENTFEILKGLTTSKSNYGIEAQSANSALLKMSAQTKEVEDDSPDKKNSIIYKL